MLRRVDGTFIATCYPNLARKGQDSHPPTQLRRRYYTGSGEVQSYLFYYRYIEVEEQSRPPGSSLHRCHAELKLEVQGTHTGTMITRYSHTCLGHPMRDQGQNIGLCADIKDTLAITYNVNSTCFTHFTRGKLTYQCEWFVTDLDPECLEMRHSYISCVG